MVRSLSVPLIGLGLWWTANTVAHNFIHRPFFTSRGANATFSLLLTALMGIPQAVWRQRHLSHHAGRAWRPRLTRQLVSEILLLIAGWSALAVLAPAMFVSVYLPGWLVGLGLCALHGHYEHAGGTTSHYGRLYNALCCNDGYHAEHHASPGVPWTALPARRIPDARTSRWPPLLRWLDLVSLNQLERLVLRSSRLQQIVLRNHRRAFERLLPQLPAIERVTIVGGGLFPRTALILRELLPTASLVIVDHDRRHIEAARTWLDSDVRFECRRYPGPDELPGMARRCDLIVIPLAFDGDRHAIYSSASSPVIVHDWIWQRHPRSALVSLALLKRLNLVVRAV